MGPVCRAICCSPSCASVYAVSWARWTACFSAFALTVLIWLVAGIDVFFADMGLLLGPHKLIHLLVFTPCPLVVEFEDGPILGVDVHSQVVH